MKKIQNHLIRFYNYKIYNLFGNKIKYFSFFLKLLGKSIKTVYKKKYKFFYKVATDMDNLIGRKNILYKGPIKKISKKFLMVSLVLIIII